MQCPEYAVIGNVMADVFADLAADGLLPEPPMLSAAQEEAALHLPFGRGVDGFGGCDLEHGEQCSAVLS